MLLFQSYVSYFKVTQAKKIINRSNLGFLCIHGVYMEEMAAIWHSDVS